MKIKIKRALDHYLGNFCLFCLSPLVRMMGVILQRDHKTLPIESIVILKFQGIGSLAIAAPAIGRLRVRYPQARIVFWGTPSTCMLAREMSAFDEVIVLNDQSLVHAALSIVRGILRIRCIHPDWAIDLEVYSKLSVLLCTLTCGRNRVGFAVDTVRLRRINHTHLVFFNRQHYLGQAYERLFGLLGTGPEDTSIVNIDDLWLINDDDHFNADIPANKEYIVINPNAGELSLERRWPIEFVEELIKKLHDYNHDMNIVIIGAGVEEVQYCSQLDGHPCIINLVNHLTLKELIYCIQNARLVISNDTAPLHFALLSDVPVIGLFGPTSPGTYVDLDRPRTRIHYSAIYCCPCIHYWDTRPCKGWNQCMKSIPVEQVFNSCVELLSDETPQDSKVIRGRIQDKHNRYYPGLVYAKDYDGT